MKKRLLAMVLTLVILLASIVVVVSAGPGSDSPPVLPTRTILPSPPPINE